MIKLRGPFLDFDGTPLKSRAFTIDPSFDKAAVDSTNHSVISSESKKYFTDANGDFEVNVHPTDDPSLNPTGFTYEVVDPLGRKYNIIVPMNSPNGELFLSNVVPVSSPNPGYTQIFEGGETDVPSLSVLFENGLV